MYTLLCNAMMAKWLEDNLKKYEVVASHSYVKKCYEGVKDGENFRIELYNTNIIIIRGSLKDRIYRALILNSCENNLIGCDEVGVGDFFGPVVYVSVLLDDVSIEKIAELKLSIKDSKLLKDDQILEVYNALKDIIMFEKQIVFDSQIENNLNSIAQKVFYHHLNTSKYSQQKIIDLFTTTNSFYKYSNDLNIVWDDNIILETKADSKYLCVALASIFARALFIKEMDKLNRKYEMIFPYGAGNVKTCANEFIVKYSRQELAKFCKTTFKTFNELD